MNASNYTGQAGCGKSYVMHCIRQYLQDTYPHLPNLLLTAGPTGTAACGIFGTTLHSMFNLPIATKKGSDPAPPLQGASLAQLQTKLDGCKIIVVDEFSMISGRLVYMIHRRCQEAFPEYAMYYFGNCIIIFLGKLYLKNGTPMNIFIPYFKTLIYRGSCTITTSEGKVPDG